MTRKALPLLLLVLSMPLVAQTVYTQSAPQTCQLADYVCNQIPLGTSQYYSFAAGYDHLYAGAHVTLNVGGSSTSGSITAVVIQAPSLHVNGSGPFQFTFGLSDGRTGTVAGQVTVQSTGRWHYAIVESSTVTVNQ